MQTGQNDAMISNAVDAGQRNMAALQTLVLKDNIFMPGEWVGGQVRLAPPVGEPGQSKSYKISIRLAGETHVVEVSQSPAK
jgi:hypothetical protein